VTAGLPADDRRRIESKSVSQNGPQVAVAYAMSASVASVDRSAVERFYNQVAGTYDWMFGPLLQAGRREAVRSLQLRRGDHVLEVGIGTGLTSKFYPSHCQVTGIDISAPMLQKARLRMDAGGTRRFHLSRMDATSLAFPDESFDVVYAAYVISVVPDPVLALQEMARVCRPHGRIVLLNHFRSSTRWLANAEQRVARVAARAAIRIDLDLPTLLMQSGLRAQSVRKVNRPPLWTLVECQRLEWAEH
jgi:phosphatidylethanolamine/phosphatidyl-N-methylethanolamine N-methyltransferase